MTDELIDRMRMIDSGQVTRNKAFDLFTLPEMISARKALNRIKAIREKMESDYWRVIFSDRENGSVDVRLESKLLAIKWVTTLTQPEWQYLSRTVKQ
ncbi:MAG: hypothetical protein CSA81_11070 [Acidobacteria bacterium]|nr:MAG: hypothetical protein CSA81_11070 [Acidobacteriota bacterium]